ncbi:MAG: hypothetical protein IKO39_06745 [Treponema sp.]|nr:hypothetical protein [Treponema sp.]
MKIVISKAHCGFIFPNEYKKLSEEFCFESQNDLRTDPELIELVENGCSNPFLEVVEIPDEATDWELNEDYGWETITYVLDGKLGHV